MHTRDDLKQKRAEFDALFTEATIFRDTHRDILMQESRYKDQLDRMRADLNRMASMIEGAEVQARAEAVKALIRSKKPRQTYTEWWPQAEEETSKRSFLGDYLKRWIFVVKTGLEVKIKTHSGLAPNEYSWRRNGPTVNAEYVISRRDADIPLCDLFVFPKEALEE